MISTISLLALLTCAAPGDFDRTFTGSTLRLDYHHCGTATEEHIAFDQVRLEGAWPGRRRHLLDDSNLGKYLFVVVDLATNTPVYSRGFCSIYGEWETIGEAKTGTWRAFHESQRFPEPREKCQVVLKKRARDGSFKEIFSRVVDPSSRFINRSPLNADGKVWTVFENGPPPRKVDLLVLGDGYTREEQEKLHGDAKRLIDYLFSIEPFRSNRLAFNVRAIDVASARSGISNPRGKRWNDTPLGLSANAFDLDRYVLTYENKAIREIAALAPYDTLALIANTKKYGGGGIFNLWLTCAASAARSSHVFVHEFGHSFGGLADEYYASRVAYEDFTPPGVEPWEPNITALLDPPNLKWKALVEPSTPIPTPWSQAIYDQAATEYQRRREALQAKNAQEKDLDDLREAMKKKTTPLLKSEQYAGKIGAYEGAGYQAKGLYRPELDCIMFSPNRDEFCGVCRRAIERAIKLHTD